MIMPDYRRWHVPGGTFFFTVVTCNRRRFLTEERARNSLRRAIETVRMTMPFEITAMVLMPDHLHAVWSLPIGDDSYPLRWKRIKELSTNYYLGAGGSEAPPTRSRQRQGERGIWQRRYWEHTIEEEAASEALR
jgi:putative transposase